MIADLVPIERRPHAFALMYISVNLGFAIAPPIGGFLAGFSFEWLFWFDAATMAVYGVIILLATRETRVREDSAKPSEQDSQRETVADQVCWSDAARTILGDGPFLLFCLSTLLIALVFVQGLSTLPIYIRQIGYSNVEFGLLMSVNGILIFVLQLPLTHWLSRFNSMSVLVVGGILIAMGFGMTAFDQRLVFVGCCIAVWTLGEIFQAPFAQSIVSNMAPDSMRGNYMGLFTMCYATALTIGAPLGGEILHHLGSTVLWGCAFIVSMIAVLLYFSIHSIVTRRMPHQPSALSN